MEGGKRGVVGYEVLEDYGDRVDDQQTGDLDHAQQVQQAIYQRAQLDAR